MPSRPQRRAQADRQIADKAQTADPLGRALRTPGAPAFFVAAAPARLGIAMTSLGTVWLVRGETSSFGIAGSVAGGFAISEAVAGPQVARLIDRYGQTRVLPWLLGVHALAVTSLIAAAIGHGPMRRLMLAAILAGASVPQMGALSAARWSALLHGSPLLPAAFSLEALSNAVAFLAGPTIAVTLATTVWPAAGSALAATLVVGGGAIFAAQRRTAPPVSHRSTGQHRAPLWSTGFSVVILANLALGGFFGSMQLSVSAFAADHHIADLAGVLDSILNCASLIAGVLYGRRHWRIPPSTHLGLLLVFMAMACLPLAMIDSPIWLGVALTLPGLAIAPSIALLSVLVELTVGPGVLTQAFIWTNSASAAGVAMAASLAGRAVDTYGSRAGFLIPATAVGVIAVLVLLARARLDGSAAHRREPRS